MSITLVLMCMHAPGYVTTTALLLNACWYYKLSSSPDLSGPLPEIRGVLLSMLMFWSYYPRLRS